MNQLAQIRSLLKNCEKTSSVSKAIFYKTEPGDYAEHDQFIGVSVPVLRKISKEFQTLSLDEIQKLMESKVNEERLLALFILTLQYQKGEAKVKNNLYQFYLRHLEHVNNWNLVDASAHLIMGDALMNKKRGILLRLAASKMMWERRISIVATWAFIRKNDLEWTFKIAEILLKDKHDLIHKAVGWMLREAGKRDQKQLIHFLDAYGLKMPRTMLRYSIEKFPEQQRKFYLNRK